MFSQNEILLMIGVVSVLLVCISILTVLDIKDYLKAKNGLLTEEDSLDEEETVTMEEPISVSLEEEKEEVKEDTVQTFEDEPTNKEVYFEEMEDESFEEKPVITPVKEEIVMPREEIKKEKKRLDILDELEEIENNLPNKKDDVTNFEMEQERTAIISLDELLKKSEDLYSDNEVVQYDDGNEPISIDEVLKMFKKDDEEEVQAVEEKAVPEVFQEVVEEEKVKEQVEEKELYSKKETIPFISSIYGIEQDSNALEFENTATYEKLDRQNQNDFITQLREMNENK